MPRPLPLTLVALFAAAGCGGSDAPTSTELRTVTETRTVFTTPGTTIAAPSAGPLAPGGYGQIVKALRTLLGEDPLVLEVYVYTERVRFRVLDRGPEHFADDYWWSDGAFQPPEPYKYSSSVDITVDAFPLESVSLDGPHRFIQAVSKIELEGAGDDSPSVSISRGYARDDTRPVQMSTSLSGTRHDVYITGDSKGFIIERRES